MFFLNLETIAGKNQEHMWRDHLTRLPRHFELTQNMGRNVKHIVQGLMDRASFVLDCWKRTSGAGCAVFGFGLDLVCPSASGRLTRARDAVGQMLGSGYTMFCGMVTVFLLRNRRGINFWLVPWQRTITAHDTVNKLSQTDEETKWCYKLIC